MKSVSSLLSIHFLPDHPKFILFHYTEENTPYLASSSSGAENHFVVREVVMAFELASAKENRHSEASAITSPML